jgi:hypothetical protein
MDPAIENQDLRPPPEPRLPWMVLLAIMLNVLLIAVVAWGLQTTYDPIRDLMAAVLDHAPTEPSGAPDATAARARTACPMSPMLAAAGAKDGQVLPPASVEGKTEKDIEALLVAGKEATAAGQLRDAEVDYLTACRVADAGKGAGSIESANARYQLARHYAAVANTVNDLPIARRAVILARAQSYYEDSLQRFRAEWGDAHEKSRLASEGLKTTRVALAQTAARPAAASDIAKAEPDAAATARMGAGLDASPAAAPPEQHASPERPAPEPAPARSQASGKSAKAQTVAKAPAPQQRAALVKPSFDCRKARSYSEKTICSDAVLAQLDRDTGRLHAKAKKAAHDPAAFKRQNDAEWRRREKTCHDRGCLLRWYADRRQQLTAYLSRAPSKADRTASR